jgi:signal transduction histidine kinase
MESEQRQPKNIETDYIESTLLGIQELKNNLVTQIAHNFRTPLSSVIGFAEMLVDDRPLTEEQRVEYARFIQYEGIRLSKLIDDLIELSTLERECASPPMHTCVLQQVVSEAVGRVAG